MPNHVPPPSGRCAHATYRMTCNEYDELLTATAGRCQICDVPGPDTKHGFLVIDHDAEIGQWAVRGLLCSNCNTAMPSGSAPDAAASYLTNPWWQRLLAAEGCSGEIPPEPPIGAIVLIKPNGRRWQRGESGWAHMARYRGSPRSWSRLYREFGPHRIALLADATE